MSATPRPRLTMIVENSKKIAVPSSGLPSQLKFSPRPTWRDKCLTTLALDSAGGLSPNVRNANTTFVIAQGEFRMGTVRDISATEFVAFDLETTGLQSLTDEIVEIGAVRFRGAGQVLGTFQQLVNPQRPIPAETSRIHGITNLMVRTAPVLSEVLPRFLEFLGEPSSYLMAHNASFDLGFLAMGLCRLGYESPEHAVLDTCRFARMRLALPNYRLETIGRYLQLIDDEEHRALEDALLLKDVFCRMIAVRPAIENAAELLAVTPALGFGSFASAISIAPPGFEDLWLAIGEKRQVVIEYGGGGEPGSERVITPFRAIMVRGTVYLTAECQATGLRKTYRLDRVGAVKLLK